MKLIKKLFGIKTTYAIPSKNGIDITKGKKYKVIYSIGDFKVIKDDVGTKIHIIQKNCGHINGGNWQIITE